MTSFILTAHLCVFPMHTSVMYCYQSYSPIQTYPGTDTPAGLYWIQSWAGLHHPLSKGNSFDSFPLPCVMRQLPRWQRSKKPGVRPSHLGWMLGSDLKAKSSYKARSSHQPLSLIILQSVPLPFPDTCTSMTQPAWTLHSACTVGLDLASRFPHWCKSAL